MKKMRQSMLLSLGLILAAGLLAAAATGVRPEKKCYNADGEEIPCTSNYLQTQFAARATAKELGLTAPAVVASATASATASPSATPTDTATATATETPVPTLSQATEPAPPVAPAPPAASSQPSALMVLVPVVMLGAAGLLVVIVLILLFRWLSGMRNKPPGSSS